MLKEASLAEIQLLTARYPALAPLEGALTAAAERLTLAAREGRKLLVCGNGGSAADSLHIVGELMKSFVLQRPLDPRLRETLEEAYPEDAALYRDNLQGAFPSIALVSETALMTAFGNDQSGELVFAQQVLGYGREGDVLLAISTSGNSPNVIHAARVARAMGLSVIALTGRDGGRLRPLADVLLNVPSDRTYQIQELHLPVYHALCLALEQELFGE